MFANPINRRQMLRAGVSAAASLIASRAWAAGAPKETGLSFEGLLKHQPGFQPRRIAPLLYDSIPAFLSHEQLAKNYAAYRQAFADLIASEQALAAASRAAADAERYGALRKQQIEAGNAVLLHEFYFRGLTAKASSPSRYVTANMTEQMGSFAAWRDDFAACARIARDWAVLVYDPYDDRWHNEPLDAAAAGGWIGANPLVVCDVADHAWTLDYKNRDDYIGRFFDHIDWSVVEARYRAVDRQ